jgi:large repetitive protein
MWSKKVIGSASRRRSSWAGSWERMRAARGRRIVFESLEDRRLLSVGMLQPGTSGEAALLASSLPAATVSDAVTGPTISQIVISQTKARISWNVAGPVTIINSTLQIDGGTPQTVSGPFASPSGGVNFSGPFGLLLAGTHTFLIKASDVNNNSTSASGTFIVSPPSISQIVVSQALGKITWSVSSPNGVSSSTIQIDGITVTANGPFATASGANFSASLSGLLPGLHTFSIGATDKAGNTSNFPGSFNISAGPIIRQVVIAQTTGVISWNVTGVNPIVRSMVLIDGAAVSGVFGPFASPSGGVNFSAPLGALPVGTHTYFISATDTANNTSTSSANFSITATGTGPAIGHIVVSQATSRVTWNVLASTAVTSSTLAVDGTPVAGVVGPFTATSGVNFSGPLPALSAGTHLLTITATDSSNATSTVNQSFTIGATNNGPAISQVLISQPPPTMSWNAASPNGVASSTLTVDSLPVTVNGPTPTSSGVRFDASLATLSNGPHTFTITVTDNVGNASTLTSNFTFTNQTVPGPALSSVVVSEARALISWNALDASGVTSSAISIDGSPVANVFGPFTAPSGVNFSAPLNSLLAGTHTYTITAFNGLGSGTTISGNFILVATTTHDPMISPAVIAQAKGRITWNVFSPNPIASSTIQIDGVTAANVSGPFTASSGVNFSAPLGSLAAGTHSYRITATDTLGRQSSLLANFDLSAATSAAAAAAQNAVFAGLADASTANSAKIDWMLV